MKTRLQALWDSLRASYWFIPALLAASSILLAIFASEADQRYPTLVQNIWQGAPTGGADGARAMLSTIAGSMITVAGVTFSIMIVALSNASSQFGPRVLRIFMRDTGNQLVLGTFTATFLYCLLILRVVRSDATGEFVPHVSLAIAMSLAILGIGVLIYFLHHSAGLIHVSNVVARIGLDLEHAVTTIYPEQIGRSPRKIERSAIDLRKGVVPIFPHEDEIHIAGNQAGYIQAIDADRILAIAIAHQTVIRIVEPPGGFLVPGATLAIAWPPVLNTKLLERDLNHAYLVGSQRTTTQEIELFFDELVEIALRALSPGINDPYTALTVINWLAVGFSTLARRNPPLPYRYDEAGLLRVISEPVSFGYLVDRVFSQLTLAASDHPAVLTKLLEMVTEVAPNTSSAAQRHALLRHASLVERAGRESGLMDAHALRHFGTVHREATEALRGNEIRSSLRESER